LEVKGMETCGKCAMYRNGCDFSMSKLPENVLKNYVACTDYIDGKDFEEKLSQVERKTGIGK
jgi:nitrogen fixation protein